MDAACAQAPSYFGPEQGAEFVTHQAIQYPARLLSVHLVLIDASGVGQGLGYRVAGYLVEEHSVDVLPFIG